MSWFGRGPHECYPDRKVSAFLGRFTATVAAQHVPYIIPGENGGKSDVAWVSVQDRDGRGLFIKALPTGSPEGAAEFALVNCSYHSSSQLEAADHVCNLPAKPFDASGVTIHVDHAHMG